MVRSCRPDFFKGKGCYRKWLIYTGALVYNVLNDILFEVIISIR